MAVMSEPGYRVGRPPDVGETDRYVVVETFPGLRQFYPPVVTVEQRDFERALKLANGVADRGLGHVELGGGPGEAHMSRCGLEGEQRRG